MLNSYDEAKAVEQAHHGEGGYSKNWVRFHNVYREDALATKGGVIALDRLSPEDVKRYTEQFNATVAEAKLEDGSVVKVLRVPSAGRSVMRPLVYVKISVPGDKTLEIDREVTDDDRERYAKLYEAFLEGKDQNEASGTLLSAPGFISPERVEEYKFFKVFTVEQLAAMSDQNLQVMGPLSRGERAKAKEYLETAKGFAPVQQLRTELDHEREIRQATEARLARAEQALAGIQAFQQAQATLSTPVGAVGVGGRGVLGNDFAHQGVVGAAPTADAQFDAQFDAPAPEPKPTKQRKTKGSKAPEAA